MAGIIGGFIASIFPMQTTAPIPIRSNTPLTIFESIEDCFFGWTSLPEEAAAAGGGVVGCLSLPLCCCNRYFPCSYLYIINSNSK